MTSEVFLSTLEAQSWEVAQSEGDTKVLSPIHPVSGDDTWGIDDGESPYVQALELLPIRPTLAFHWDIDMPASSADIGAFDGDGRTYISVPPDLDLDRDWLIVAALEPSGSADAFAMFLVDYLSTNGAGYGAEIFGSLPNRIENHDRNLVRQTGVSAGIEAWATWAVEAWDYDLPDDGEPGWLDRYMAEAYREV